jgi:Phosphodiester glycosidase
MSKMAGVVILGWILTGCAFMGMMGKQETPRSPDNHQALPAAVAPQPREIRYQSQDLPHAHIHWIEIPTESLDRVHVALSDSLQTVEHFAQQLGARFVLNAGFFDPQNGLTTSFVTIDGTVVADPHDNAHLMENPNLVSYLDQILNRSELRRYSCAEAVRFDITTHDAPIPADCALTSAVGAGPQLLPIDTSQAEGFTAYDQGTLIRDAIGSQSRNARTAVGIKPDDTLVWVMVAQKADATNGSGMTLAELATYMQALGIDKGLNLDGGSSSALVVSQETLWGRLDAQGNPVKRPVKSVLWITPD